MSLRRRNIIAYTLLLVATLCWTLGQWQLRPSPQDPTAATAPTEVTDNTVVLETMPNGMIGETNPTVNVTIAPTTYPLPTVSSGSTQSTIPAGVDEPDSASGTVLGVILCILGAAAGGTAVLLLRQRSPLLGPDGAALILALFRLVRRNLLPASTGLIASFFLTLLILILIREFCGWLLSRLTLDWCLVGRLARHWPDPRMALLTLSLWLCAMSVWLTWMLCRYGPLFDILTEFSVAAAGLLGFICLMGFGADLRHFKQQLDSFQRGQPITVRAGSFDQTERQLLEVQAQHEEAIRTAITSERFKVELIANVSHDLRTPLTAILGYSELLQEEAMSAEGTEQLRQLTQKAGYMRDLVESLFELTKVSSGVIESKRERIDLLRLLEQTIGLFDDQLTSAQLRIRRHYAMEQAPVITDGARMHQVFANLLGNAIKYALPGTRLHLEVKEGDETYTVRMTNIASYEMDFQPEEIMERFVRGDKARSTKGSGIGLAIAQTYTESVGGTFRVAIDGDQFSAIVELPKTERNL